MRVYSKEGHLYEAVRLIGSSADYLGATEWLVRLGLPWLEGDACHPETLVNKKGELNAPGIYIDPMWGSLIIRTVDKKVLKADYGDWIVKDVDTGTIEVVKDPIFIHFYRVDTRN